MSIARWASSRASEGGSNSAGEALRGEHASRSDKTRTRIGLVTQIAVASLPNKMKPEPTTKQRVSAVAGLLGVKGGSARGEIGRGTWETPQEQERP